MSCHHLYKEETTFELRGKINNTLIMVMPKSITHNIGVRSLNSTVQYSATCVLIVEFNVIGAPLLPFFNFVLHF